MATHSLFFKKCEKSSDYSSRPRSLSTYSVKTLSSPAQPQSSWKIGLRCRKRVRNRHPPGTRLIPARVEVHRALLPGQSSSPIFRDLQQAGQTLPEARQMPPAGSTARLWVLLPRVWVFSPDKIISHAITRPRPTRYAGFSFQSTDTAHIWESEGGGQG